MSLVSRVLRLLEPADALTFVDVGALGGLEPEWKSLEPYLRVVEFEPDERAAPPASNSTRRVALNIVLADESKELLFHCSREPGNSSTLAPNLDWLR